MANAMRESDDEQRAPLEIRRAAIDTCLIFALANTPSAAPSRGDDADSATTSSFSTSDWPTTIRACQYDPDARIRKTFGRWLAVARHPDAVRLLKLQLADKEVRVRETALMSLGVLHTVEARTELQMQAKRSQPRVRMFAIKGLAHWGTVEIASFASDSSFSVRQVVAEEAAHSAGLESALLLQKLLVDSSGQVQATVVQSISGWPDELAIPLCLHGMRGGLVATRRSCFQKLRKRTNIDDVFPVDAPPKKRAEVVMQLVDEHNLPVAYWDQLRRVGLREHEQINERHIAEIHADLRAITTENARSPAYVAAKARLMERSAADLPIVEKYLLQNSDSEIAFLYRELLPSWSPVHEALQQLEESDVFVRRRSAQQLARIATDATLSPLAARRLRRKMTQEQDRLVWRYVMSAAMHDGTDESAQLALLAVNHTWPDIRLLGCEFIARHARPQYALWLMPLFHDRNKNVRLAAVQAAGHCRNPQIIEDSINPENGTLAGLRSVMTDSDQQLRFAAAVSLSQLGDGQGMQELIRMSYSQNAKIRIRVVEQMGLTGRSWFIDHMIQLAWTESNDSAKRAILRSLDQLVPMEKRPQGLADEFRFDAKIKIWVTWQQERHGKAGPAQVATSRLSKSH